MGTLALPHGAFPRFKKEFPMRKHIVLAAATAAALFISGCANMSDTQRRTATGAGVGAAAGAVLGAVTGGRAGTGAVIGAGVGALGTDRKSTRLNSSHLVISYAVFC